MKSISLGMVMLLFGQSQTASTNSELGFTPHFSVSDSLPDSTTIARVYSIDNVVIKGKTRTKHLGRRIESNFFSTGGPLYIGDEMGIPCDAGKKNWQLRRLQIYCTTTRTDTLAFRLRLYRMEDKTVGEAIPIPEILIPRRDSTQFITADLSPYDIRVTGHFLLALECTQIHFSDPRGGVYFNGRIGARTYYRDRYDRTQWGADLLGIGLSVEATPAPPPSDTAIGSTGASRNEE